MRMIAYMPVREIDNRVNNLSFHNLTPEGTVITRGIKTLLGLSLKFCPTPRPINSAAYTDALPSLFRSIRIGNMFSSSSSNNTRSDYNKLTYVPNPGFQPVSAPRVIENQLTQISNISLPPLTPSHPKRNLNYHQRRLLDNIRHQQQHLKILATDKNLGPAVMTMEQYRDFCMAHLNQPHAYEKVDIIPIQMIRDRITRFHQQYIRTFPSQQKDVRIITAYLDASTPAYFHGIPKIHKQPMGCRPIVSNVTAPTNGLSRWLTYMLQPFACRISSYIRDSKQIQVQVQQLPLLPTGEFYTFDVEHMYTSIPVEAALDAVNWFLLRQQPPHPARLFIIEGLRIVMQENYFTFGDTNWKQKIGLAMGTPVAPVLATLYLGYYEEQMIMPQLKMSLYLYKRYLDDILIIWKPNPNAPHEFNRFRALLRRIPGLSWTWEHHPNEVNFLDLWIYKFGDRYGIRTHQKVLNLYLYPTFSSAHPPGVQKGLIYGLLLKYQQQNTQRKDFIAIARLFFQRLRDRGFHYNTLKKLFDQAISQLSPLSRKRTIDSTENKFFFKIPYDPNGPPRSELRKLLQLDTLSQLLSNYGLGRVVICYTRPKNLGNLLTRTKLQPTTPAAATSVQDARGTNPNPNPNG